MKISLIKVLVALGAMTVAAACSYETSVTRNVTFQEIGQERALTRLGREFMAQTPYTVNFDFDQYDLDDEAIARLDAQAKWILAHPEAKFSVYGHTDLMGGNGYNQQLGLKRAQMVVDYLVSKGVSQNRLEVQMTLGEEMPLVNVVAPNEENRRATTFVSGWIKVEHESMRDRQVQILTPSSTGDTGCAPNTKCGGPEEEEENNGPECRVTGGCGEEEEEEENSPNCRVSGGCEEEKEEEAENEEERRPCRITETCERPERPNHESQIQVDLNEA